MPPVWIGDRTNRQAQPERRRGRTAVWERLALLGQNWLAGRRPLCQQAGLVKLGHVALDGISPGYLSMLVNEGRAPSGRIVRLRPRCALGAAGAAGPVPELAGREGRDQPRPAIHNAGTCPC